MTSGQLRFWVLTALLAALMPGAALTMDRLGSETRSYRADGPLAGALRQGAVVNSSPDLLAYWKRMGLRGRIVITASRHLHFRTPAGVLPEGGDDFPLRTFDLAEAYERKVGPTNYLWVAANSGIFREVHHLMPRPDFQMRVEDARGSSGVLSVSDDELLTHDNGLPRRLRYKVTAIDEPVVLNIDASYFDSGTSESLMAALQANPLRVDVVTFYFASDNSDVTDSDREALARFISEFGPAHVLRGGP